MCGITGCVLKEGPAAPLIHESLKRLEYRGYDSCGEATVDGGRLYIKKDRGTIDEVHRRLNLDDLPGRLGIGHTRWATHGAPTRVNAHPHVDCDMQIAVVHNGIIENFAELRMELEELGHKFRSKTDTEVVPHLVEEYMRNGMDFVDACREAIKRLRGSYALAILHAGESRIVCARRESPLVLGVGEDGVYFASDIPAFLPYTNRVVFIEDGEMVVVTEEGYEIRRISDWTPIERRPQLIEWSVEMAERRGYPHFMLKEIHEQPACLRNTLRLREEYLELMTKFLDRAEELFLVACGTSYHACLAASYLFSKLACKSSHPVIASEFIQNYGRALGIGSTILAVSQSGETADTLSAVAYARDKAATILGITNVVGSTLTRLARVYICQQSGPEIGVAATKTYTSQLSVLTQLAIRLGMVRGKIGHVEGEELVDWLWRIPGKVEEVLASQEGRVMELARKYAGSERFLFFGGGINLATAMEGRLKLLEISYIPSLAYARVEDYLLGFVDGATTAVFVCPNTNSGKRLIDDMTLIRDYGVSILALVEEGDDEVHEVADEVIELPHMPLEELTPIPYIVPLQLLAYYISVERGLNPDKPRNLAKSVTVK